MRYSPRTNVIICIVLWLLLIHIIRLSMLCRAPRDLDLDLDPDLGPDDRVSSSYGYRERERERHQHQHGAGAGHGKARGKGNAYVFYATSNLYACSTMVNVHRLTRLFHTPHPIYVLVSSGVSIKYTRRFRDVYNATVLAHEPPLLHDGAAPYYQDVMLKLLAFGLNNLTSMLLGSRGGGRVERVIVMDADVLVLRSLDGLFDVIGDAKGIDVAAPHAYWLEQRQEQQQYEQQQQQQTTNAMDGRGGGTERKGVTSAMMVLKLSDMLWGRVEAALDRVRRGDRVEVYDMDLINEEFFGASVGPVGTGGGGGGGGMVLPGAYCTLNSHWEVQDLPSWSKFGGEGSPGSSLKTQGLPGGDAGAGGVDTHHCNHTVASNGAGASGDDRGLIDPLTSLFYDEAHILHFTAMGKPWSVTVQGVHQSRPEAHPLFAEQFLLWRRAAKHVCPSLELGETGWDEVVGKRYTYPDDTVMEGDGSSSGSTDDSGNAAGASPVTDMFLDDI